MVRQKSEKVALFLLTKNDESDEKEWAFDEQKAGRKFPLRRRHRSLLQYSS